MAVHAEHPGSHIPAAARPAAITQQVQRSDPRMIPDAHAPDADP